jgi:riboflavin kinase/FMN adenylyltransferase
VKKPVGRLRVAHSLEEIQEFAPRASAVTLGVFDGVHLGHQAIVEELVRAGSAPHIESVFLITFDPHPVVVTHSRAAPPILSTIEERLDLLGRYPIDGVLVVRFDEKMQQTDYRDFIQKYMLDGLDMRALVLGYDCHFGKNRGGSPESVQAEGRLRGFEVRVVPPLQIEGQVVSSTFIRNALQNGDLDLANRILGHPYTVAGRVERGAGKGRSIGFPTANLNIDHPQKLWPPRGVYAVTVKFNGQVHNGMMNVGTAPTLKGGEPTVEIHVIDFEGEMYGTDLIVYCYARLRGERTFPSADDLAAQLEQDRRASLEILSREGN